MKRLKTLLIGLLCLVVTLPIVYTNNVYAAYENIVTVSIAGRQSYSGPADGSKTWTSSTIDFSKYSELKMAGKEQCCGLNPSHSITIYAVDAETGNEVKIGSGSWGKSMQGDSWVALDYSLNLLTPSFKKGIIKAVYSWSNTSYSDYENGSCWGNSNITGTITGTLIPHTHSYTPSVTTEATCTTDGETTWTCSCGDSYTTPIPAPGHTFQTLTINGSKAAERCIKCGFLGSGNLTTQKMS